MTEEVKNPYERTYPAHLTLEWLLQEKLPIFVRNTTRPRGQIAVNFPSPNGRVQVVKILRTHLPIQLSERLGPETIMLSDDFRQCLSKGVVDLIRPDLAWSELQEPENMETINDLQLSAFSSKNAFVSKRVQDMEQTVANRVDPSSPSVNALGVETQIISPRILRFVEQLKSGDLSIKAAMSELKTMEPELKDTDCSYIIANGPDGQIRSFVQKVLAKMQNAGIVPHSVTDTEDDWAAMTPKQQSYEHTRESQARAQQNTGAALKPPPQV